MKLNRISAFFVGVASATAVLASAAAANAATFTVNGTDYDITTKTGTFASLESDLTTTPWWGNQASAELFAGAVGSSFGEPVYGTFGPFFIYAREPRILTPGYFDIKNVAYYSLNSSIVDYDYLDQNSNLVYAVTTKITPSAPTQSVPEPGATIPVAVVSLIALGALKKSRKSIALKTTIANPVISVVS